MRKKHNQQRAWLRAGIQMIFFLTMPGAFVAGFSGAKHILSWIGTGQVLEADSFVKVLIGLCAFTILFGRYFCGFVCAFGGLGDLVYWLSGLIQKKVLHRKKVISLPGQAVAACQKIKYVVLIVILGLCAGGMYGKLSGTSPWDVFSQLTALRLPGKGYGIGILLFALILAGMAVQPRFFCQFLCPMGALFAMLPVMPFARLQRKEEDCIRGCSGCERRCPVNLKLASDGRRAGECIACELCTGVCPKSHIKRLEDRILPGDFLPVIAKAVLFFGMGCFLGLCRWL